MIYLELVSTCSDDLLIGVLKMIPKSFVGYFPIVVSVSLNFIPEVILGNTRSTHFNKSTAGSGQHRLDTLGN